MGEGGSLKFERTQPGEAFPALVQAFVEGGKAQAHFIHEFKSLYGASPRVFLQREQAQPGMLLEAYKSSLGISLPDV